ncbi:MAG: LysM peptidoglycan-binding domain-containing protein [Acidimicrobiales bacterium]
MAAWLGFLVVALVLLHHTGGALAPPPLTTLDQLGAWFHERAPGEAVVALARLGVLGVGWYLLAATVLGLVAGLSGRRFLLAATDAVATPLVRRLVSGSLGLSMAATSLAVPGVALASATDPPATAVTMHRLPDQAPPPALAEPAPAPPAPGEAAAASWEVQPGQHFWSVAEQILARSWGRPPGDGEIDPYWRTLVEANRSLLRDPTNPDLLFPGQVLTVPPPPSAP